MQKPTVSANSLVPMPVRAARLFTDDIEQLHRRTDHLFAGLMACQWLAGVLAGLWIAPLTWAGADRSTHPHIWAAVLLGGAISLSPLLLALLRPGRTFTRHTIAFSQMLMGALFIRLTGGRI